MPSRREKGTMIDALKRFINKISEENAKHTGRDTGHDLQLAACALFLELARIDESFTEAEMETLLQILKQKYGLSHENADALIAEADAELKNSVDLWQFARLINENYSNEEKIELIERLWQIVFVDGKMDKYEHYLMNRLSKLLRLSHKQLIDAKMKVLHPEKKDD
jgi:uncharacterized tellurite resistance protein B-like protein